ncbi:MAG TPA: excisionase family DNA-binding protein [Streptosporangiaceae bacterium]|nr:excisionase family DNA-binding protein [Streptosporangiaceae bacterium]
MRFAWSREAARNWPERQPRRLESIASAAEALDVSERTIRRRIADGSLRAYRVGPRLIKVDRAEVDKLIRPVHAAGNGAV